MITIMRIDRAVWDLRHAHVRDPRASRQNNITWSQCTASRRWASRRPPQTLTRLLPSHPSRRRRSGRARIVLICWLASCAAPAGRAPRRESVAICSYLRTRQHMPSYVLFRQRAQPGPAAAALIVQCHPPPVTTPTITTPTPSCYSLHTAGVLPRRRWRQRQRQRLR